MLLFVPMAGLSIAWASMMGNTYALLTLRVGSRARGALIVARSPRLHVSHTARR